MEKKQEYTDACDRGLYEESRMGVVSPGENEAAYKAYYSEYGQYKCDCIVPHSGHLTQEWFNVTVSGEMA